MNGVLTPAPSSLRTALFDDDALVRRYLAAEVTSRMPGVPMWPASAPHPGCPPGRRCAWHRVLGQRARAG